MHCAYIICTRSFTTCQIVDTPERLKHHMVSRWCHCSFATNNIKNTVPRGDFCYISSNPLNCEVDPFVDCDRGENFILFAIAISYAPNLFSFFGIVFAMLRISYKVHAQESRNATYRFAAGRRASVIGFAQGANQEPRAANQEILQAANQEILAQRRQSFAGITKRALSSIV